jgi:hypothetical protein
MSKPRRGYDLPYLKFMLQSEIVPPEPREPEQLHDGTTLLAKLWSLPSHLRPGEKDAYVGPR